MIEPQYPVLSRVLAALKRLEEGQQAPRREVGTLHGEVDTLPVGVMERIDRLQNAVAAMRDDITVTSARRTA